MKSAGMLNAEHVALESRLVSQMVSIRQREMDMLLERYSAIGTQASLLAGFAITQLTALDPSNEDVAQPITYAFYITSLGCVLSSMHVVICTMYVCNWAPRLALRGPTGSISRAYSATRSEKQQINIMFTIGTLSFALQTVSAIWVMDGTKGVSPHSIYATILTTLLVVFDVLYHKTMHMRFFGSGGEWSTKQARTAVANRANDGGTVLNNPLAQIHLNPDAVDAERPVGSEDLLESDLSHRGMLSKRSLQPGEAGAAGRPNALRRLAGSVAGEWRDRYFVLHAGKLNYWTSEVRTECSDSLSLHASLIAALLRQLLGSCMLSHPRSMCARRRTTYRESRQHSIMLSTCTAMRCSLIPTVQNGHSHSRQS